VVGAGFARGSGLPDGHRRLTLPAGTALTIQERRSTQCQGGDAAHGRDADQCTYLGVVLNTGAQPTDCI
jgi:hypothetical protein